MGRIASGELGEARNNKAKPVEFRTFFYLLPFFEKTDFMKTHSMQRAVSAVIVRTSIAALFASVLGLSAAKAQTFTDSYTVYAPGSTAGSFTTLASGSGSTAGLSVTTPIALGGYVAFADTITGIPATVTTINDNWTFTVPVSSASFGGGGYQVDFGSQGLVVNGLTLGAQLWSITGSSKTLIAASGYDVWDLSAGGSYTVQILGNLSSGAVSAGYTSSFSVSPLPAVPEPNTAGLLVSALAMIGLIVGAARRAR